MSMLQALAEVPGRVEKHFITPVINAAGIYAVTMYVNGDKTVVLLDDWFPVNSDNSP